MNYHFSKLYLAAYLQEDQANYCSSLDLIHGERLFDQLVRLNELSRKKITNQIGEEKYTK